MAIQVANPFAAFMAGKEAREAERARARQATQEEQQGQLLQQRIDAAPAQMADEAKLRQLEIQGAEQGISNQLDAKKTRAFQQLGSLSQQALKSGNPRAFVEAALRNPQYASLFAVAGVDPSNANLDSPDFEKNLQVLASFGAQPDPDTELRSAEADKQRTFTAEQNRLDRLARGQQGGPQAPAGYRFNPDGTLAAIPGGPADPSRGKREATPTEGERKSAALGTRLEGALRSLAELETRSPGVSRPGVIEKGAGMLGETAANLVRSSDRQQANATQLDALDAALTLATGAAYTREQLKNLSTSYFPQLGDTDETAAAKKEAFQRVVQAARISAGRAEPSIDMALDRVGRGASGSWDEPGSAMQPGQSVNMGGFTVTRKK